MLWSIFGVFMRGQFYAKKGSGKKTDFARCKNKKKRRKEEREEEEEEKKEEKRKEKKRK